MPTCRPTPMFVVCLALLPSVCLGQSVRRTVPKNVLAGSISAIDASAATIAVTPRSGAPQTFRLTEKTRILRAKRSADLAALKSGDAVVVRFRKVAVGPPSLYDLCDKPSWEWLDRIRHETTRVTVRSAGDEELKGSEGSDGAEIAYRVTDKTQWAKAGKSATPADFGAGDTAFVTPRMLPSGAVMAAAVSDTAADAARLKERTRTTVTGTIRSADAAKRVLAILSAAGDERRFSLDPAVTIRMASKAVPVSYLRPGLTVTVHFRRQIDGDEVAFRLTVQTKKGAGTRPIASPKR